MVNGLPAGAVYSGETTSSLSVSGIAAGGPYSYRCVLTNSCGSLNSNTATLTISGTAAPANPDNPTESAFGCDVTLSRVGAPPVNVNWYWQGAACSNITTLGSGATYIATASGTYGLRAYNTVAGCWSLGCGSVYIDALDKPLIITQPNSAVVGCNGSPVSFFVEASGSGLTYQWQEDAINLSDAGVYSGVNTPTLTISNPAGLSGRTYRCLVSGACNPTATSTNATLTVLASGLSGVKTVGATGDYIKLKDAFDAINVNGLSGNLELQIISNITETAEASLSQLSTCGGSSAYKVKIYPTGATRTIDGNIATSLITLNGADYVTIDGRLNQSGAANSLIISNTNTSGSALKLIGDASNNTVKYATFQGIATSITTGVIHVSTGTITGNDFNVFDYCTIKDGSSTPRVGFFAEGSTDGTLTKFNDNNTISNCNIYNFFAGTTLSSFGIYILGGNSKFNINNNSLYQTASRTDGYYFFGIYIYSPLGQAFNIESNYIGGQTAGCGGAALTLGYAAQSPRFRGIYVGSSTSGVTFIKNNTIKNISYTCRPGSATDFIFFPIMTVQGRIDVVGNTIGDNATGSITLTVNDNGTNQSIHMGIYKEGDGHVMNNTIGSTTINGGTGDLCRFYGIQILGTLISDAIISGNVVGSATTANSIITAAAATPPVGFLGILFGTDGNYRTSVTNNIVANVTLRGTTGVPWFRGIDNEASAGTQLIFGNEVRNISNAATTAGNIIGIINLNSTTGGTLISQNKIHSLKSTNNTTATNVYGIYHNGPTGFSNTIEKNFIHSFYTNFTGAFQIGLYLGQGPTSISNNMIRLGIDQDGNSVSLPTPIYGIYKNTTANTNFYFNSIYIGGNNGGAASNTFGLRRLSSGVDDFKNNIIYNARTGAGNHYAIAVNATTTFTSNYNVFFSSNAAALGSYDGGTTARTFAAWQAGIIAPKDANSYNTNPNFVLPANNASTVDLHLQGSGDALGKGVVTAGITTDYDGQQRKTGVNPNGPCIGADEYLSPPLAKNAYGIYMPAVQSTGTIADCEIYAVGGTPGGIGFKVANPNDANYANVMVSTYHQITAENKSCTNIPIDFTTADPSPDWLLGNGALPPSGVVNPMTDVEYSSTGRKDIIESVKVFKDFINITMAAPLPGTILGVASGCPGTYNYVSSLAGSAGFTYAWSVTAPGGCSASVATPTASATDITFFNTTGYTQVFTIALTITTECCGPLSTVYLRVMINPGPTAPVITGSPFSFCEGGTATVNLSTPDPVAGNTYNWYTVATGGTPILINNTFTFSPVALGNTTFYCEAINAAGCPSPRTAFVVTGVATPSPTVVDASVCGAGTTTLGVTGPIAGYTYVWYSGACGGVIEQTGLATTFNTTVSANTTYYVAAIPPGCAASACAEPVINYVVPPATIYWLGVVVGLNNWYEPTNWTSGCIPTSSSDVVIVPNGGTVIAQPDIGFSATYGAAACKSFTLQAGSQLSFSDARAELQVYGNSFDHSGTIVTNNMGRISFRGAIAQSYSKTGSGDLYNVLINNTSGTGLTLNNNMIIVGEFIFTRGFVYSALAAQLLQFNDNATANGASDISFVDGPVLKVGDDAFAYPIGKSGIYAPLGIAGGANNSIIGEYYSSACANNTLISMNGLHHVSYVEYWELQRTAGTTYPDVTLYWYDGTRSGITDLADLRVAHWNTGSSLWDDMGGSTTGAVANGTITNTIAFTSYSPISFGSKLGVNPLPINLFNLKTICEKDKVLITWSTVSETNNEKFVIEKSSDLKNWSVVGIEKGSGNSNARIDYSLIDTKLNLSKMFYRIKTIDFNGEESISGIAISNCGLDYIFDFNVYKTDKNDIRVEFTNDKENLYDIRIHNSLGSLVAAKKILCYKGLNIVAFDNLNLKPGIYLVSLISANGQLTKKLIIEF